MIKFYFDLLNEIDDKVLFRFIEWERYVDEIELYC